VVRNSASNHCVLTTDLYHGPGAQGAPAAGAERLEVEDGTAPAAITLKASASTETAQGLERMERTPPPALPAQPPGRPKAAPANDGDPFQMIDLDDDEEGFAWKRAALGIRSDRRPARQQAANDEEASRASADRQLRQLGIDPDEARFQAGCARFGLPTGRRLPVLAAAA